MLEVASNSTGPKPEDLYGLADTAWILVATALVFIMIPALGYFYGGLAQRKSALSLLLSGGLSIAVVSIQWYFMGYSLVFSERGTRMIGTFRHFILKKVGSAPHSIAPNIPANLFMIYENMFAVITPFLAFGGAAERGTLTGFCVFLVLWSTFVYDFIAYWTWGVNGWLRKYDALDFAGGTPVHIASGFSAIAYAIAIGPRKRVNLKKLKPTHVSNIYLGTALLWFGWMGFNGGSEFAINSRAVNAVVVSNLSACAGGMSWLFTEMLFHRNRKMSLTGFCSGALAGLVCITPAAGFVTPSFSLVFGITGGFVCFFASKIKHLFSFQIDDACDVFGVHGIGGVVGNLLTGLFATNAVATMAGGPPIKGGWLDHHYFQLVPQIVSVVVSVPWSFAITYILVKGMNYIPFIRLKLDADEQKEGPDLVEIGESVRDEYAGLKLFDEKETTTACK